MSPPVLFREVQQFRQWWLWLLIAPGPVVIWVRALRHLVFESGPRLSSLQIVSWLIGGLALPVFLYSIRLVTEVRSDGLYLRFFPFHLSYQIFPIDGIRSYEAITYSPLREYGGWGIRYGWNGKAYNVSGNQGLQLELNDGKRILLGSQHPTDFLNALRSLENPPYQRGKEGGAFRGLS